MDGHGDFDFQSEIEQVRGLFQFDFVGLALVQLTERHVETKWAYVSGNYSQRYERIVLQAGKGIAGTILKTGKSLHIEDVEKEICKDELYKYPILLSEELKSFVAIPLFKYHRVQGVLLGAYRDDRKLTSECVVQFREAIGATFGPFYLEEMFKP